jgi:nitronate monooxygenase
LLFHRRRVSSLADHDAMSTTMIWTTKFTKVFQCSLPIMGAPMAGISGGLLAAESVRAGALGFVAAGHATNLHDLELEVELFRNHAPINSPLGLGFISHSSCKGGDFTTLETVLQRHRPQFVQFFAPAIVTSPDSTTTNIKVAQAHGAQVLVQVGSIAEAKQALVAGVDAIIAQGSEAGGHGLRRNLGNGTFSLAARIAQLAREYGIPVLAAGGMVDGHSLAAALALGCDGIVLGTRLWASREAIGREEHKVLLTTKEADDCTRTTVVDQIQNSYSSTPWPFPYDSVGVLKNTLVDNWDGRAREELEAAMETVAAQYQQALKEGDTEHGYVYAGEGVGGITSVDGAYDIIQQINTEAIEIVNALPKLLQHSK